MDIEKLRELEREIAALTERTVDLINSSARELPRYRDGRRGAAMDGVRRVTLAVTAERLEEARQGLEILADLEDECKDSDPGEVNMLATLAIGVAYQMYGPEKLSQYGIEVGSPAGRG